MSEENGTRTPPISIVRFGMGKEIRLYKSKLVVSGQEEDEEIQVQLGAIQRLILMPGDPNPSKLVLMADLEDETTIILAEGIRNKTLNSCGRRNGKELSLRAAAPPRHAPSGTATRSSPRPAPR